MIDSHIHITHRYFDDFNRANNDRKHPFSYIDYVNGDFAVLKDGSRELLIDKMKTIGIRCCIDPAIDVESNWKILRFCEEHEGYVYAAVGKHPKSSRSFSFADFQNIRHYMTEGKDYIVAVGETGLDYSLSRIDQCRILQKLWFQWQIDLAHEYKLPLILHIRDAHADAIRILRRNRKKLHGGVCHCFYGDTEIAKIYTEDLGFCLGIGGSLLAEKNKSESLVEAMQNIPMEYILLETDGPFLKPAKPVAVSSKQWKKAQSTSLILPAVAERIAELKNISTDEVIRITDQNAMRVFKLKLKA